MNKVILDSSGKVFINGHELKNVESISSETNYLGTNISIKFEDDFRVIELSNISKLLDLINEKELSKEDLNLIFKTIKPSIQHD